MAARPSCGSPTPATPRSSSSCSRMSNAGRYSVLILFRCSMLTPCKNFYFFIPCALSSPLLAMSCAFLFLAAVALSEDHPKRGQAGPPLTLLSLRTPCSCGTQLHLISQPDSQARWVPTDLEGSPCTPIQGTSCSPHPMDSVLPHPSTPCSHPTKGLRAQHARCFGVNQFQYISALTLPRYYVHMHPR